MPDTVWEEILHKGALFNGLAGLPQELGMPKREAKSKRELGANGKGKGKPNQCEEGGNKEVTQG